VELRIAKEGLEVVDKGEVVVEANHDRPPHKLRIRILLVELLAAQPCIVIVITAWR